MHTRLLVTTVTLVLSLSASAAAQRPAAAKNQKPRPAPKGERGFIAISGGLQVATPKVADRFTYDVNAEPAQVDVRHGSKAGPSFDGMFGLRLFKWGGAAVGVSRSSISAAAHVEADVPHPFFDNQDRHVSGDTGRLERAETAIHADLYWLKSSGRWRIRVMGGATYFRVEHEAVTAINVDESYPFDTAAFRSATTRTADGSAPGFNVGADGSWMLTRQVGLGALVRFTRGSVDLNVNGTRNVSVDTGGVQAGAGIRFVF